MEFTISGQQALRQFAKFLGALSRIGDKLNLEPKPDRLKMSAVNSSKSAFAMFHLLPRFFVKYKVERGDVPCCSLLLKSLLSIFRARNMDRNVQDCLVKVHTSGPDADRIVVQLRCTNGVLKTHRLHYEAVEAIHAVYSKQAAPHQLKGSSRFVKDLLGHFHNRLEEVTLSCGPNHARLVSFNEWGVDSDILKRELKTEVNLVPGDFETFHVANDVELTVNFKELKGVLQFGDLVEQAISIYFDAGGSPMIFTVTEENLYIADFVMATIVNDDEEPATGAQPTNRASERATANKNARPATANNTQGAPPPASFNEQPFGSVGHSAREPAVGNPSADHNQSVPNTGNGDRGVPRGSALMVSRGGAGQADAGDAPMPSVGNSAFQRLGATYARPLEPEVPEQPRYWETDMGDDRGAGDGEDDEELPPTPPRRHGRMLF